MRLDEIAAQVEHTLDEEFWKWFKHSKVTWPNKTPKVVYHGAGSNFSTFLNGDIGFHVGTMEQSKNRLNRIKSDVKRLLPLYASIQKPLRTADAGGWKNPEFVIDVISKASIGKNSIIKKIRKSMEANGKEIAKAYTNVGRNDKLKTDEIFVISQEIQKSYLKMLRMTIQKLGYDGIVYRNEVEGYDDSYIVFQPSQIKSIYAMHFNPNDDNIFD